MVTICGLTKGLFSKSFPNVHGLNAKVWQNARQRFDHLQHCHERLCKETGSVVSGMDKEWICWNSIMTSTNLTTQHKGKGNRLKPYDWIWLIDIIWHSLTKNTGMRLGTLPYHTLSTGVWDLVQQFLQFTGCGVDGGLETPWCSQSCFKWFGLIWDLHDLML